MTQDLWLDTETFSPVELTTHGTHRYAEKAEVIITSWAVNDEPAKACEGWNPDLEPLIHDPATTIYIHNSAFDRTILRHTQNLELSLERIVDPMVVALMHSLPGGLGPLCDVLGIDQDLTKIRAGKELIKLFCKPLPKNRKLTRADKFTHPAEWVQFMEYARMDIEAMRAVMKKLPKWNATPTERALWVLDQRSNDRGYRIDLDLAQKALDAVGVAQDALAEEAFDMTDGGVTNTRRRDVLLDYLREVCGYDISDLRGPTIRNILQDDTLPEIVRELLLNRQQASLSSTAKYKTLIRSTSSDGRLRSTIQFCGASRTGRDAGRIFQPQNLSRCPKHLAKLIDTGIESIKGGYANMLFDNVMELASACVRGSIIASENRKLVVADLSNIEGRVAAWLAGEDWKLKAFKDYDTIVGEDEKGKPIRKGHDLYALAYAKTFNVSPESVMEDYKAGGSQRQIGKTMELALQYQGGVGAFVTFATLGGLDLEDLANTAWPQIPRDVLEEADRYYDWAMKQNMSDFGLSRRAFVACDSLKRMWRAAHPAIVGMWDALKTGWVDAVDGRQTTAGRISLDKKGAWVRLRLPSGRYLSYPSAGLSGKQAYYYGPNPISRKWGKIRTYAGKTFEQCCQSVARDVIFSSLQRVEDHGYEVLLRVHDELVAETLDNSDYSAHDLSRLMAQNPDWAPGLPLAAAGFEAHRYRKD